MEGTPPFTVRVGRRSDLWPFEPRHQRRAGAARRAAVASNEHPFAVLFGCSDSRLANGIIFDRDLDDLLVVRAAGQVSARRSRAASSTASTCCGTTLPHAPRLGGPPLPPRRRQR
ncbi:carbonic anhydrase [Amycolatopsis circi]|uniref:carbonic anhydrase n=1 Tax=Amycolatopsis circi TaxID=871959 RepID=UPI003CC5BDC0